MMSEATRKSLIGWAKILWPALLVLLGWVWNVSALKAGYEARLSDHEARIARIETAIERLDCMRTDIATIKNDVAWLKQQKETKP